MPTYFDSAFRTDYVTFQAGAGLIMASLVGWLVSRIHLERENVERRAEEAEALRDELGRRADLLDAANRCARALNSSLDLDEAFDGVHPRAARARARSTGWRSCSPRRGSARVIATSGAQADEVMPPGTILSLDDNVLAEVISARPDRRARRHGSRPAATRRRRRSCGSACAPGSSRRCSRELASIGLISVGRSEPDSFTEHEIELVSSARAARRVRRAEHPRLRERAPHRRGAAAALRAAGRLRLARLARAAQPDGRGDRRGAHAADRAGASCSRTARGVPRPDRRRDGAPRLARRRRARHVAHRRGHVQLPLRRRRLGALVQESVADGRRSRRTRCRSLPSSPTSVPPVRGDAAAPAPGARQPDRQRGQVLAGRRARAGAASTRPNGTRRRSRCATTGPGIASEDQRLIFEKFGRVAARQHEAGHRPRALHRPLDRRGPRRLARGRLGARPRGRRSR